MRERFSISKTEKKKKKRNEIERETEKPTLTSSKGVLSGISRNITIQRLWFGRTFSPSSSTCTLGDSVRRKIENY